MLLLFGTMTAHARTHREGRLARAPFDRPRTTPPRLVDTEPEDLDIAGDAAGDGAVDVDVVSTSPEAETLRELTPVGARVKDTGELYGVRMPHADDPALAAAEDRDAYEGADRGENWLEALSEHATESGPRPEEEVVIIDDSDRERGHSPSESGDRPVADKGAGGPGGL